MAVPGDGSPISLASIRGELENNSYAAVTNTSTSLKDASDGTIETINAASINGKPDGNTPHYISEFRNYDNDAVALTSFARTSGTYVKGVFACGESTPDLVWINSSSPNSNGAHYAYTSNTAATALSAGNYGKGASQVAEADYRFTIGSNGLITTWTSC